MDNADLNVVRLPDSMGFVGVTGGGAHVSIDALGEQAAAALAEMDSFKGLGVTVVDRFT